MRVLTIARPLLTGARRQPFVGSVCLVTRRVVVAESCEHEGMLAVAVPDLGDGPFSLVVDALPVLRVGTRVELDTRALRLGQAAGTLADAEPWSPRLAAVPGLERRPPARPKDRQRWCDRLALGGWIDRFTAERLRSGARALQRFCAGRGPCERAAARLAGLGPGLTPAGDDYLLGACAALHLTGDGERAREIAEAAAPRTTRFSAAFLLAAGQGELSQPWHELRRALVSRSPPLYARARERLEAQGSTSGAAAWAGFLSLGLAGAGSRCFAHVGPQGGKL